MNHIKIDDIRSDLGIPNKITDIIKKKKIKVVWSCDTQWQCQLCQPFIQEWFYQLKTTREACPFSFFLFLVYTYLQSGFYQQRHSASWKVIITHLWFIKSGLHSSVESTEKDIETRLTKAWTAINRLLIIWKSDLIDKMKRSFFQAAVTSILLYGCTTWTLTKWMEKKLDGNYTRMLCAILYKSWQQHPTRHQLYGHLPPITKTIQVRRTRHAGHCWRSRDELIRDVLLWIPTHGRAKAGRPARTYIQQLCEDTGCCPEDLPRAMNDREEWRERVRDIRATSAIWWWWWH